MWEIQVQLWLHLADHYLRHDHVTDAHAAVMEAVSIGQGLACGPQVCLSWFLGSGLKVRENWGGNSNISYYVMTACSLNVDNDNSNMI